MNYRSDHPERKQQDATIRRMWGEGETAKVIAAAVGITRNAVIGRAHRMGLPGRPSPIPSRKQPPPAMVSSRPAPATPPLRPKPTALTADQMVPTVEPSATRVVKVTPRDGDAYCGYGPTCRFPLWAGGETIEHARRDPLYGRFCTAARDLSRGGSPYCAAHRARCYTTRTAVAKLDLDAVGKVAA